MRTVKIKVKYINKIQDWYRIIFDDLYIVHDIDFSIDNVLVVIYSSNDSIATADVNNQLEAVLASV